MSTLTSQSVACLIDNNHSNQSFNLSHIFLQALGDDMEMQPTIPPVPAPRKNIPEKRTDDVKVSPNDVMVPPPNNDVIVPPVPVTRSSPAKGTKSEKAEDNAVIYASPSKVRHQAATHISSIPSQGVVVRSSSTLEASLEEDPYEPLQCDFPLHHDDVINDVIHGDVMHNNDVIEDLYEPLDCKLVIAQHGSTGVVKTARILSTKSIEASDLSLVSFSSL